MEKQNIERIEEGLTKYNSGHGKNSATFSIGPNKGIQIVGSGFMDCEYKTPKQALALGSSCFEELTDSLENCRSWLGGMKLILHKFVRDKLLTLEEMLHPKIAPIIEQQLDQAFVIAQEYVPPIILEGLVGEQYSWKQRNAIFKRISNKKISEALRIHNYVFNLAKRISPFEKEEGIIYKELVKKENKFSKKLLEFAFRLALSSGHQQSLGLLGFLGNNPEFKDLVDPIYIEFALPYLAERDLGGTYANYDREETQMKEDMYCSRVFSKLGIDVEQVRKFAKDSVGRVYMPRYERMVENFAKYKGKDIK